VIAVANQRLPHDVAFVTLRHILEVFASCLREEEQRAALTEIYERVKAGLECFEIQNDRMARRLQPARN
jgi:hypothetical protein